jgi:hypothetical protein
MGFRPRSAVSCVSQDSNWEQFMMTSDGSNRIRLTNVPATQNRIPDYGSLTAQS